MSTRVLPLKGNKPNIPELRKAVEWVEEQTELPWREREWSQGEWFSDVRRPDPLIDLVDGLVADCGTSYCIAGFVALNHGWTHNGAGNFFRDGEMDSAVNIAGEILGLNIYQANSLFDGYNDANEIRRKAEQIAGERL